MQVWVAHDFDNAILRGGVFKLIEGLRFKKELIVGNQIESGTRSYGLCIQNILRTLFACGRVAWKYAPLVCALSCRHSNLSLPKRAGGKGPTNSDPLRATTLTDDQVIFGLLEVALKSR